MKTLSTLLLLLAFSITNAQNPCPIKGDKNNPKFQHLDSLKNRNTEGQVDKSVTLEKILTSGNDEKRFTSNQYVSITGYVILVKAGGSETCNCHSKDPKDLDVHIEIAEKIGDKPTQAVIVEINRLTKADNPEFSVKDVKEKYLNKKVTIEGWMFFDEEHIQNAVNTNPNGTNLWRATCWEVHPVMKISK